MIYINKDKAAAMTTEELFAERATDVKALHSSTPWATMTYSRQFEIECEIQTIENELQDRGAIEFKDRLF